MDHQPTLHVAEPGIGRWQFAELSTMDQPRVIVSSRDVMVLHICDACLLQLASAEVHIKIGLPLQHFIY